MSISKTTKPAIARHDEPVLKIERFGRQLSIQNIGAARDLQAARIRQRFGFPVATARVLAALAFGEISS